MTYPKVYPHSAESARLNDELQLYRESKRLNQECAQAIDKAIADSNYEPFMYNLAGAMLSISSQYGIERMNLVLAYTLQNSEHDGRYSSGNKA